MNTITYEASIYSREVTYRNFKGVENTVQLDFALDPLELLSIIAGFETRTVKSGNPARNGQAEPLSGENQLKFVRDLATRAAGTPSEDGESWISYEDFGGTLAGKAFLTKLAASDQDRRDFAQKVILDPFRAFVNFAKADSSNTQQEVQQFEVMLGQIEKVFSTPDPADETIEAKRARLAAEMAALGSTEQMTVNPDSAR